MKHIHDMPFGPVLMDDGGVRFRLFAPSVANVWLRLDGTRESPMETVGAGWFESVQPGARPGSAYQFRLPSGLLIPDPASRYNPKDVHGPSEVVDPKAFDWPDAPWRGRPWEEAVIYELHVGTFTRPGTFDGVIERLDALADLGITALELMPVADFPGRFNWGYDGVLLFAPDATYGRPEDLKRLISAAHERNMMVLLDVVYNHFGPEGNYLHAYAPEFFTARHETPWGDAVNFEENPTVRNFFIQNALFWLEEYQLDGLRIDAIHAIFDSTTPDIITELTQAVRTGPGTRRHIHLILENDRNQARYLRRDELSSPILATAQWNDDIHHVLHVLTTGEKDGYYADYTTQPVQRLGRCLTQGFAYQGEPSPFRDGERRGEPSAHLPPGAFVHFSQTHDQVGNRAFGERLCHLIAEAPLEAITTILLLAPHPPMLFMGEEFAAAQPFLFFSDFGPDLASSVTEGRRREFSSFSRFSDPSLLERIPDPCALETFRSSTLDWNAINHQPHQRIRDRYRQLLTLRHRWLTSRLHGMGNGNPHGSIVSEHTLCIRWILGDGSHWTMTANPSDRAGAVLEHHGRLITTTSNLKAIQIHKEPMPPWSVAWHLQRKGDQP
ncbi:MAG: malto-oligosyltrehalose trehalohydrolase [Magnetococcales bacterium]|nr:malto-oligosyltrehalose trehalohydrolase [Magnetococcales bacterium]